DSLSSQLLGLPELKAGDRRTLKNNAVLAVALLLAVNQGWFATTLTECLDKYLWQPELLAGDLRYPRAALADCPTPATLGLVAQSWHGRLRELAAEVGSAVARARAADEEVHRALRQTADMAEARGHLEKLLAQRDT